MHCFKSASFLGKMLVILSATFFLGISGARAQEKKQEKPPFTMKIELAKPEQLVYAKGEKIKFLVSVLDDKDKPVPEKNIKLSIAQEGSIAYGTAAQKKPETSNLVSKETPAEFETSLDSPGFVLCYANLEISPGKSITASAGASVAPQELKPALARPNDFMDFWKKQKEELAKIPMNPVMTPVPVPPWVQGQVEAFDVKLDCLGDMPVRGYYARPTKVAPKSLPAYITFHGSGVRSANHPEIEAFMKKVIMMDINAHGIENGKPEEYYKELTTGKLKGYRRDGCNDRDKIYFKGMFLRAFRALEFLKAQPEWDGKTLIVWGSSQGGTQAFVAAALDPQVSFCVALMPGLCNNSGQLAGMNGPWPGFLRVKKDGTPEDPDVAKTVPYYDMVNFAPEIKAKVFMSAGLMDDICPASGIHAAYNSLKCPKEIINYQLTHGGAGPEPKQKLEEYLKEVKGGKTP